MLKRNEIWKKEGEITINVPQGKKIKLTANQGKGIVRPRNKIIQFELSQDNHLNLPTRYTSYTIVAIKIPLIFFAQDF